MVCLSFFQLIGRLHPLVVHLPIGMLILAFIFEVASRWNRFRNLRFAVRPTLLIGAVSSLLAVLSGYGLSLEGGYEDDLLSVHRNLGFATAGLSVILYFILPRLKRFVQKKNRKQVRIALLGFLCTILSLTGHWGGSLTHGEDFLFAALKDAENDSELYLKLASLTDIENAILYQDVIHPILSSKCFSCHSATKQKGELRLDDIKFIQKGGKHGQVVRTDVPDSSALYKRLVLPIEDEHHMPPREKPQLTSAEMDLIHSWIQEGSDFNKKVSSYKKKQEIGNFIAALQRQGQRKESWVPSHDIDPAPVSALDTIRQRGAIILPVAHNNNYMMINLAGNNGWTTKDAQLLLPLQKHLVWLDYSKRKIEEGEFRMIGKCTELRFLYLKRDSIPSSGLKGLGTLKQLQFLNLVGTALKEEDMKVFDSLEMLKEIYLFETGLPSAAVIEWANNHPKVKVDTGGYQLTALPTDTVVYKQKKK